MKVLAAIDDSQCSRAAIENIANQPWWGDTKFLILHVVVIPTANDFPQWGFSVDTQWREELAEEAQKLVQDQAAYLKERLGDKIEIACEVVQGPACQCIAQAAIDWDADLIVMGSHGRTGLDKLLMGSVAEGVLLRAPCSVEIVKPPEGLMTAAVKKQETKAGIVY
jgi:nucleotide-binding universal stress UspA family protein